MFLLIRNEETYLCQYHLPKVVSANDLGQISLRSFLQELPIPFEEEIVVEPHVLNAYTLNRVTNVHSTGNTVRLNYNDYYANFENRPDIKPKVKQKPSHQSTQKEDNPLSEFIKSHMDFSDKQTLRKHIHSNYMKRISLKQDKIVYIPKLSSFCFINHGNDGLVKHIFEEESPYIVCTDNLQFEIVLRQIALLPKFCYHSVYTNNMDTRDISNEHSFLLYSKDRCTIILSNKNEVLDTCRNFGNLKKLLKLRNYQTNIFRTNSVKLRRQLHDQHIIKRTLFFSKKFKAHLNRLIRVSKSKYFSTLKVLEKKGVMTFTSSKLPPKKKVIHVHDIKDCCASTITRYVDDYGMRKVFTRLVKNRQRTPELKSIISTLFGMAKHYHPTMFYQTLNDMVYVMYKIYSTNNKHIIGMCKDSFFTKKKLLKVPIHGFRLRKEYILEEWIIKNQTTFIGIDQRSGHTIIKGLAFPPFAAAHKIVSYLYKHVCNHPNLEHLDIPYIIEHSVSLSETDFFVIINKKLKSSDFFYYGLNPTADFVYATESLENPIYHIRAAEPSFNIRPKDVCGEIDFKQYSDQIMNSLVIFAKTFHLTHILNETVLCETDLFLKLYIQQVIFRKADRCHLPMFQLPDCQLEYSRSVEKPFTKV